MSITVVYFGIQGAVSPIRMVLHHADVKYNFHVVEHADWAQKKSETPYGHLPVLKIEDEKYAETIPILRYLGEKYGLVADTPEKRLYADSIVEAVRDIVKAITGPMYTMKPEERKAYFEGKRKEIPTLFEFVEKQMGCRNQGGYLAGKLTWQDCQLIGGWKVLVHFMGADMFSDLPNMEKYYETVSAHPSIKSYFESTKDVPIHIL